MNVSGQLLLCTNLSHKQIPHHLSGGVSYYLALHEFDS